MGRKERNEFRKDRKAALLSMNEKKRKELKDIALDIYKERIFTSWNVRPNDDEQLLTIFLPLFFAEEGDIKKLQKRIGKCGFIYEYISKACPTSINGYPVFMSLRIVENKEAKIVLDIVKKLKKQEDSI